MPNFDGTGPNGKGPMTGRGRGYCVLPITIPEQELDFLKNQEQVLEEQLKQIKARVRGLSTIKKVGHARI
jgi:hypothetical protein